MHEKLRILFVDDESRILSGLRRMLHGMRREWDMAFATGGSEALDVLAEGGRDVIVSDMRMPGIDGVALMTEVRARYPQMVRIALSGQASKGTVLHSVGVVHQYLAKPCDAGAVKAMLTRVSGLNNLLGNEALRGRVANTLAVPSLPALLSGLTGELESPGASANGAADILSRDLGMSARVMQFVSSAFFAQPRRMLTPAEAAVFLGVDILKALALSTHAFAEFSPASLAAAPIDSIVQHSLAVADGAQAIAVEEGFDQDLTKQAFVAGLFHDIGKLVLAVEFPERYAVLPARRAQQSPTELEAERELFGATHSRTGAFLMGLWGLPREVVEALAFHHNPSRSSKAREPGVLTAVHAANVWAHEVGLRGEIGPAPEVDAAYLAELGLIDRLPQWRTACHGAMHKETANV